MQFCDPLGQASIAGEAASAVVDDAAATDGCDDRPKAAGRAGVVAKAFTEDRTAARTNGMMEAATESFMIGSRFAVLLIASLNLCNGS